MTVHWGSTALVSSLGYGSSGAYLNASVPASLLTNPGTFNLTIVMPGGIVSAPFAFPVYVAPVVTGLNPNATTVGSTPITLTVTGSNFVSGAKVSWTPSYQNSTLLNATFISTSKLTVTITPDMRLDAGFQLSLDSGFGQCDRGESKRSNLSAGDVHTEPGSEDHRLGPQLGHCGHRGILPFGERISLYLSFFCSFRDDCFGDDV